MPFYEAPFNTKIMFEKISGKTDGFRFTESREYAPCELCPVFRIPKYALLTPEDYLSLQRRMRYARLWQRLKKIVRG